MHQSIQDWRQAVRMPTAYRVGNSTLRLQTQFVIGVAIAGISLLLLLHLLAPYSGRKYLVSDLRAHHDGEHRHQGLFYNSTYPLTIPQITPEGLRYRIAVISDLDTDSKDKHKNFTWISYLKRGHLTIDISKKYVSVEWDKDIVTLQSTLSQAGRGMELSELVVFDGKLLAFDDRTGVVYEISGDTAVPWILLADGNGKTTKGFKSEWATVKDEKLWVGGLGKEWTTSSGELMNFDPQWIKVVSPKGHIEHQDWRQNYISVRSTANIHFPGYMIHEAVCWSDVHREWFFLPRRASTSQYSDLMDERKGTNLLLRATDDFSHVQLSHAGPLLPTHGFSSFKFVPGTRDTVIVAIKTEESNGHLATFITVFTILGEIWLPEVEFSKLHKFEGIEFV